MLYAESRDARFCLGHVLYMPPYRLPFHIIFAVAGPGWKKRSGYG